jgi:uncharacterized membrane protein YhaH (DUF805 family)
MQLNIDEIRASVAAAYGRLFGGRIARTSFVIRVVILLGVIALLGATALTILATSSTIVKDLYRVLFIGILVICLLGFVSAYVKRLHDIGFRGYWAIVALIGFPGLTIWALSSYAEYRWFQDKSFNTADVNELTGWIAFGVPLLLALWRGDPNENRFGPVPQPVEHITASKFNLAALGGAAVILIPLCIYAGLFQRGVWVGRGEVAPAMPTVGGSGGSAEGFAFMKCWNVKGVGAGSGKGDLGGVYRDSFDGAFDFVQKPDGQIDIIPLGQENGKSYLADGFKIVPYGLPQGRISYGDANKLDRFMLVAYYDQGGLEGTINFTTFTIGRVEDSYPDFQVVMSTALSQPKQEIIPFPLARGRLMIGDCRAI